MCLSLFYIHNIYAYPLQTKIRKKLLNVIALQNKFIQIYRKYVNLFKNAV